MINVNPSQPQTLPDWMTPELIAETLGVWQPHYPKRLTDEDAIEILRSVGQLFDAFGDLDDETVSSASESIEP